MALDLPKTEAAMLAYLRERSLGASPFTRYLDIDLVHCWAGEAELVMPIRAELTQHRGTVHGGVIGSIADNACGYAIASLAGAVVTSSYTLHLLAPSTGEMLRAVGRTLKVGRRLATASADVFAETGGERILVATALATMALASR